MCIDRGWAVKLAGGLRVFSVHNTWHEAIDTAREIARNKGSELFIRRRNGHIRDCDSHGSNPYPHEG